MTLPATAATAAVAAAAAASFKVSVCTLPLLNERAHCAHEKLEYFGGVNLGVFARCLFNFEISSVDIETLVPRRLFLPFFPNISILRFLFFFFSLKKEKIVGSREFGRPNDESYYLHERTT